MSTEAGSILALLAIYQGKHFAADYLLQGRYMLGKFRAGWDFLGPLVAHVAVHAAMTFGIAFAWRRDAGLGMKLALVDFGVHFAMDRIKAGPKYLGRWKPDQRWFWWALGLDQMVHHLTHYALIWALVW